MNIFDMRTILFSYVISSAICAVVMVSLWWQNRRRLPGLAFWMTDFIMQGVALLLIVMRDTLPDILSMLFSNSLVIFGTLLLLIGLERYTGKVGRHWHNYLYFVAFLFVQTYFVFIQPSLQARNINIAMGLFVLCSQSAWLLLRRVDPGSRSDTRAAGVVFGAFSLVSLFRISMNLVVPSGNDLFSSGFYDTLVVLTYQMLYISLTFALFLMVNRRMFIDLENDNTERKQIEQTLRETSERLAHMLVNSPTVIYAIKVESEKIIPFWISENIELILGFTSAEGLQPGWWLEQIHPEDRPGAQKSLEHLFDDFYQHDYRFYHKDGGLLWLQDERRLLRNAENQPWEIIGTWTDITERKQVEEELKESKLLFHLLIESLPQNIYAKDVDGRFVFANQNYCATQGKSLDDIVGKTDFELHPPELAEKYRADDRQVVETDQTIDIEEEHQPIDGDKFFVQVIKSPLYNIKGQTVGTLGIFWDITGRKQAESALRQERLLLRTVIDNLPDAIYAKDKSGRKTLTNRVDLENIGVESEAEILGKSDWDVYPKDVAARFSADDQFIFLSGQPVLNRQELLVNFHGQKRWLLTSKLPLRDESGEIVGLLGIGHDITERKRVDQALRESEQRYRLLFDEMLSGFAVHEIICDPDGRPVDYRFLSVNVAFERLTGISAAEIIGKTVLDVLPATEPIWIERYGRVALTREPAHFEDYSRAIGKHFDVRAFSPEPGKFAAVFNDVSERKQAESALKENEERWKRAIADSPIPIMIHDEDDRVIQLSAGWTKFSGYIIDDIPTLSDWTERAYGERTGFKKEYIDQLFSINQTVQNGEWVVTAKDGSKRIWDFQTTPLGKGYDGKRVLHSMAIDITERKQADDAIQQYSEKLEEMVEERTRELRDAQEKLVRHERLAVLGQLAGSIGHELRNPLGVISNAIYFLKMAQPDASDKVKEYLDILEKETRTSSKIVTDLLDFTRIKTVDREPVSVSEIVNQTLQRNPAPPSVQVAINVSAELPKVYVDPQHIIQVLGNLVANAFQAMTLPSARGQANLMAGGAGESLIISAVAQNDMINVSVKDTGPGVRPENMDKLFQPLFTTKPKGIGLGLAISQKLTQANGGHIKVQSEVGKGSTFTICLPIYKD